VLATWRTLGGDGEKPADTLSSVEAFAAALNFSPQMALARAQVEVGRAGVLVARQRPNPVLSLSPERVVDAIAGISPWVVAISLVWPVQTAGKRSLAIEQALATSDASLLNAANAIWSLRASVRGATCSAELANTKVVLAREDLVLREDLVARVEKQANAGVATRYEAARTRLERDAAAQRLRQSEAELRAAKHDLAAVTGLPIAQIDGREIGDTCLSSRLTGANGAMMDAAGTAVAARLDLRAKLAEFRVADAAWRTEIAKRTPDLNLGPGYTYDRGEQKITFTISGELPLYARNDAAIARASAERSRVIAEIEILQQAVIDGVARAGDQLISAETQYGAAIEAAAQTQKLLARNTARQVAGELDQPAVVLSRIALVIARSDILGATVV
jgi:outer membrane protein, heavy metal efflux system